MTGESIIFQTDRAKVEPIALQQLLSRAAFWAQARSIEDLNIALSNSEPVVSAWDGAKLVGCARATSDGIYRATIWDVVVDPDYQRMGIGRKLLDHLLAHPHLNRVEKIYLMTTHHQAFYERAGFTVNPTTTMVKIRG
jgi:ribosomal protein S18 acetylase RimI-like enzyme